MNAMTKYDELIKYLEARRDSYNAAVELVTHPIPAWTGLPEGPQLSSATRQMILRERQTYTRRLNLAIDALRGSVGKKVASKKPQPSRLTIGPAEKSTPAKAKLVVTKVAVPKKVLSKMDAARKIQGQYLGLLRHLADAKQRAAVKNIAKTKGVPAAVAVLLKLRGK